MYALMHPCEAHTVFVLFSYKVASKTPFLSTPPHNAQ